MYDLISIGDSAEDTFLELEDAKVHCDKGAKSCVICFHYADKIPVRNITKACGGNAANNAVGSSRLGLKAAIYTELGSDVPGREIFNDLKNAKVSTEYVFMRKSFITNHSVILNYDAERTIFVYHAKRKYFLPKFRKCSWLYYTSLGEGFAKVHPALISYIKKNAVKLAFNPGTYQLKSGLNKIKRIIAISDVLFLNKEEAQFLLGTKSSDTKVLLKGFHNLGANIVVITDADRGSFAYDGKNVYHQKIFPTKVVERTGCGDAYATGFIASLFYGNELGRALGWGSVNAASVLSRIGPQEGLLKLNEIKHILTKNKNFKAARL